MGCGFGCVCRQATAVGPENCTLAPGSFVPLWLKQLLGLLLFSLLQAMQIKAEREAKELEGATFAPEITRLAKALWSGGDLESQPAWQRLSQVRSEGSAWGAKRGCISCPVALVGSCS